MESTVARQPWSASTADVRVAFSVDDGGLAEHDAAARLTRVGPNALPAERRDGPLRLAARQFASPLIGLLVIAAAVSLALGELVDAVVIAAALVLNAVIGFIEEWRAARSMEALQRLTPGVARVLRDGTEHEVDPAGLVPGDVILVVEGSKVPADCRVVHAAGLEADESILTGESASVAKGTDAVAVDAVVGDRTGMLHHGTVIVRGRGRAIVTATGSATELGGVASGMRSIGRVATPLQRRMNEFSRVVAIVVVATCAVGFVAGIALGEDVAPLALALVALAVAAVPEGLPIVLTVALAISMQRMAGRRAVIRRLAAVETLGSCSVIGSDKTGTLTRNRMVARAIVTPTRRFDLDAGSEAIGIDADLRLPLIATALCNDATAVLAADGFVTTGDPTEVALVVAAARAGFDRDALEDAHARVAEIPFASQHRFMATFNEMDGGVVAFVKGAPEEVLAMCSSAADGAPLDAEGMRAAADRLAADGMRVLASAYRPMPAGAIVELPEHMGDLRFLALHGLMDPPRDEARAAVEGCRSAGIRVLMITGDHAATALAVAREVGIAADGDAVLTGSDIDGLDADGLRAAVRSTAVFARVSPAHKLAIVEALRADGETVAVTGDGVNDAPALRAADIGVAMGRSGTDVAREAADVVILDDDFASIVAAVEEGRIAFSNVRKTTFFLVSTGAAAIVAVLASIFGRFDAPFLAAQMIWMNVVTNGVQDVALAFEPGEPDVLRRRPRPRGEGILSRLLWERTVVAGVVMAAGTLALFGLELARSGDLERARTVALTTMVLFSLMHVGNARSEHASAFARSPFANRFLFVGSAVALALHVGAMHWGPTQSALRLEPLPVTTWLLMLATALTIVLAMELHKALRGPGRRCARV